jgi:hypothetical protein
MRESIARQRLASKRECAGALRRGPRSSNPGYHGAEFAHLRRRKDTAFHVVTDPAARDYVGQHVPLAGHDLVEPRAITEQRTPAVVTRLRDEMRVLVDRQFPRQAAMNGEAAGDLKAAGDGWRRWRTPPAAYAPGQGPHTTPTTGRLSAADLQKQLAAAFAIDPVGVELALFHGGSVQHGQSQPSYEQSHKRAYVTQSQLFPRETRRTTATNNRPEVLKMASPNP